MKKLLTNCISVSLFIFVFYSCADDEVRSYYNILNLPEDQGGEHIAYPEGTTDSPYGYYVYKPSFHDELKKAVFPTLIFLHGSGEKGSSLSNPAVLDKVLVNGPPKMIEKDEWDPSYPMLVFSPQSNNWWNTQQLKEFVEYIIANYKVNVERIYLTGLSMGGYGTFAYIGDFGNSSFMAAAVPICGAGKTNKAENFKSIPLWAFHGEADQTVPASNSINMVEAINNVNPDYRARLTIFPGVGHNSWTKTYTGSGMGTESENYDAFDQNIYDWMFQYKRTDLDTLIGYYK